MTIARSPLLTASALTALAGLLACGKGGGAGAGSSSASASPTAHAFDGKVALRYHPPQGALYHYAMDQLNQWRVEGGIGNSLPPSQFGLRVYFTQSITGPTDGGVGVKVTFDSTKIDSPTMQPGAMNPALDRMRGMVSQIVYDDHMRVVRAGFTGATGQPNPFTDEMSKSIKVMAFPLPDTPVGQGDSWTTQTELPVGQMTTDVPLKATTKLTVKRIQIVGSDTSVVLSVETTFPGEPITVTNQGQKATLRLTGGLSGEQVFSVTKGAAVHFGMSGTMHMDVQSPGYGANGMAMTMQQRTALNLAP